MLLTLVRSTGKLQKSMIEAYQNHILKSKLYWLLKEKTFIQSFIQTRQYIKNLKYVKGDVRDFEFENCSYVTSLFTLQFMPPKDRKAVIDKVYNGLNTGGAFVFSEKVYSCKPKVQDMMTFMYYGEKRKHFSADDILDKEGTTKAHDETKH